MIDTGSHSSNAGFSSDSISYILGKLEKWNGLDGSVRKHVGILGGRNKLKLEFFEDFTSGLQPVCRDIHRLGYAKSRVEILRIMSSKDLRVGSIPFFGKVDVILSGLSDACGFRKQGDELDWW
ncbi:MAG: hypothetical protein ACYCT2_02080 [Thermoplasmataceae archaeon]